VEAGISGIPRTREWDEVASAQCGASGEECVFVALERTRLLHLHGAEQVMECAAQALELDPPYRAVAVRREGETWAVGGVAIEVAELPADTEGEELMLIVTEDGERALEVDGRPTMAGMQDLEQVAGGRFEAYVLRATRLQGPLWEIGIDPL
jgi:transcriptional regulator GlxA family with amidase domain